MADRTDFVKRLRENPKYREALGRARNAAERKAISDTVEGIIRSFGDIMGPAIDQAQSDPEFAAKLARALQEHKDVLNRSQQPTSGST